MTPETQQARASYRRPDFRGRGDAATTRSAALATEAARTGDWDAAAQLAPASPPLTARAKRAREDASIVGVVPLLAVLVVTVAGVYIAWRDGSAGGGEGGVVAGAALLVGALARLLIPARLAGLLATRKRTTDVVTLAIFGVAVLVAGLVLPR